MSGPSPSPGHRVLVVSSLAVVVVVGSAVAAALAATARKASAKCPLNSNFLGPNGAGHAICLKCNMVEYDSMMNCYGILWYMGVSEN